MANFLATHYWIIALVLVWTIPWKGAALWRAARRAHLVWFLVLLIVNTLGILEILYLFIFSNLGRKKQQQTTQNERSSQTPMNRSNVI